MTSQGRCPAPASCLINAMMRLVSVVISSITRSSMIYNRQAADPMLSVRLANRWLPIVTQDGQTGTAARQLGPGGCLQIHIAVLQTDSHIVLHPQGHI